ncbi:VOC family protein [Micromonospora taraxaci]|uniref:VOC family protein n=1 Tax=Micromonospora taraxaci TaxID=1316803 RepID=UPI0033DBA122
MGDQESVPRLGSVVLDGTDARVLAEFYRHLLGYVYRPGDEPPAAGQADERGRDWLVLRSPDAAPSSRSSRWITCRKRPGRRTTCLSSCTWT